MKQLSFTNLAYDHEKRSIKMLVEERVKTKEHIIDDLQLSDVDVENLLGNTAI